MSMAICPYCSTKLQIPGGIAPGIAMLCGNCNNQFLPPQPTNRRDSDDDEYDVPRKKKKRRKMATNTMVTLTILGAIVVLLSTLGILYLMEPSHAKFNEVIVSQYHRMHSAMQSTLQIRQGTNNIPGFLRQFQPLSNQLQPILKELKELRAPEDAKYVLQSFTTMVESLIRFSDQEAPQLAERFRRKPNDQEAMNDMMRSLVHIAESHNDLVQGQHGIARKYGLLQIETGGEQSFFMLRER